MGLVKCTTAIENASYSLKVGEVVDTSSYLYARFPTHFSAEDVELDTLVSGAPANTYTLTYSTAARTVPAATYAAPSTTAAAHTYPASGNLFDAVAADLLINVRTDTVANAVADVVVNVKSIADNLNQEIVDRAATNTQLAALAADVLALKKVVVGLVADLTTLGLVSTAA